ncbi:glycine receptor subunit alpha-3-like isoform X1 [Asterias amurensis]|uniref:glycine receptor subunit alpha-3-like isoform X1 n=2 Tax=Asterias amurensis TaxID=7602 RepID=UPI003AB83496
MYLVGEIATFRRMLCIVIALMLVRFVNSTMNTSAVLEGMFAGYDKRIRPSCREDGNSSMATSDEDPPVRIYVQIYIESIDGIKETTMDFSITMYLRMKWQDSRLAFNGNRSLVLAGYGMDIAWLPDVYFVYEKQASPHLVTQANKLLRIYPNGSLSYSGRFSITVACNMQLNKFPMDSQKCTIIISSYAYNTDEVVLYGDEFSIVKEPGIMISKFKMTKHMVENKDIKYSIGNFSGVRCNFYFTRQVEAFFLTVYIPTVLLVTIAWLSFWIDAKAAPARVALGVTTVLTVTTMTAGIQNSLPVVTYAKAIDIWLVVCLMFVFISLLEYGAANYLLVGEMKSSESPPGSASQDSKQNELDLRGAQSTRRRRRLTANQLDRYARWCYPFVFSIFCALYWIFFLTMD